MTTKEKLNVRIMQIFSVFVLLFLVSYLGLAPETDAWANTVPQSAIENPTYTLTTTKDTSISTKANPNETTVLIFGYPSCGKTRSTLNSISACEWVKRSDIRVIFAENSMSFQEDVQELEEALGCPEITFCYNEDSTVLMDVTFAYQKLWGLSESTTPFIVLIDKNNKVQNMSSGAKTADEILTEIKKFENLDESGSGTPPTDSDFGVENHLLVLKNIDGSNVSTKATPNQTTVLLFGDIHCAFTNGTLKEIDQSSWVGRSDIRVIFADAQGAELANTKEFAQKFSSGKIIFCHDESGLNFSYAMKYLNIIHEIGGTFPYIVLIDQYNKIQLITLGPKTADEIITEIEKFAGSTPPGTENQPPAEGGNQNTDNNQGMGDTPNPAVKVSAVNGLKAESAAKTVKLSWSPVSNVNGYVVYQYDNSKKTWVEKAELDANTLSYSVKKLSPALEYRFAVRAFVKLTNGTSVFSESYAELDTATAPNAVKLKVRPGKKKATLKWNKVKGASGYTVYYKTKAKGEWKKLKNTKGTSVTKTKLKSGKTYYFMVKAYKKYKNKTYTSTFSAKKTKIK